MSRFTQELSRYRDRRTFRSLPELTQETVEFELPLDSKGAMMRNGEVLLETGYLAQEPAAARPVVYLAVVDESGGPEYHDVMAEVLDTCVQRLPDDCRLGVVTVSDRVGLVDLAAPLPHVQLVDLGSGMAAGGGGGQGTAGQPGGGGGSWTEPSSAVGLSEVMSLEELLCPIGGNRELISANVRGLRGACRDGGAAATGRAGTRVTGLAVKLLLDLLLGAAPGPAGAGATSTAGGGRDAKDGRVGAPGRRTSTGASAAERGVGGGGFAFAGCRLMLFLGGAPDRGPGAVGVVSPAVAGGGGGDVEAEGFVHDKLFRGEPRALGFYRGQAYRAASCGVSVDVHCFANKTCGHFGLSSLAPLAMTTGGGVYRHSLLHQREGENRAVTVAREVCAELLQPRVYDGLLRVRTSAEFNVNRDGVYGNLTADPRLESLWHVASCYSGQSFAMDFEFRGAGGGAELQWDEDEDASATVQSAFAYTAVVPDADASSEAASDNAINGGEATMAGRMVTVRRLRVSTVRTDSSPSVEVVATAADPATVAAVLAHKVVSEARRSGFTEARGLLRDWLANFISGLAESLAASEGGRESAIPGGGGVEQAQALMANPLIVGVARQVFGLLQSPVLHPTKGIADERVSLLSRLSSLDPESLSIALYPEMQGYATPDIRLANSLSLSRQAVTEASPACRIFVVDTFWRVVVHYADSPVSLAAGEAAGEAPLPFPPSRDSAIGQYLEMRRAVRPLAGQEVVYSRPGTPEAFFFEETLLEDRPLPRAEKAETFKGFFAEIIRDVLQTS
ncbi:unnamed protein product [Ectocarpus sp. 12 AP-2014]